MKFRWVNEMAQRPDGYSHIRAHMLAWFSEIQKKRLGCDFALYLLNTPRLSFGITTAEPINPKSDYSKKHPAR